MADSSTLPGLRSWPNMPPEWWRFFRDLSTTTTTATVDLSGYLPTTTNVQGSGTIQITGTLANGSARFDLRTLANATGGSFLLVTRDTYGRISESSAGDATDVPVDDSAWTEISGADVQAALDSTDASLAGLTPVVSTDTAASVSPTAVRGQRVVLCNCTSNAITVSLPTAVGNEAIYNIKKTDSTANAVTIDPSGAQTIDGAATAVISVQFASLTLVSDGSNWHVI